jgi:hypothetical protein
LSSLSVLSAIASALLPFQSGTPGQYALAQYPGFGWVVASAGDVDSDGFPDLVIGDPGPGSVEIPPVFWWVSGRDGSTLCLVTLEDRPWSSFVAKGGTDLDGDGTPDVLLGEIPFESSASRSLTLVSGASGSVVHRIPVPGRGRSGGDWFQIVDDADGDAVAEIGFLDIRSGEGRALITRYSGVTGEPIGDLAATSECSARTGGFLDLASSGSHERGIVLLLDGDQFHGECRASVQRLSWRTGSGRWVRRCPDRESRSYGACALLDGVGSSKAAVAVSFYDAVEILDLATGRLRCRMQAPERGKYERRFGHALASLGDIDDDGVGDLAVSSPWAQVLEGNVTAHSGKDGRQIWEAKLDREGGYLGESLAALGDIDRDGVCDLVAGTEGVSGGRAGVALVLSGRDGAFRFEFRRRGSNRLECIRR